MSRGHRTSSFLKILRKEFILLAVLIFSVFVLSYGTHISKPFVSSEVKFADSSGSGLSIVPASCESGVAHYSFIYAGVLHSECDCPSGTTFGVSGTSYTCLPNTPPPPPPVAPPPPPPVAPPPPPPPPAGCTSYILTSGSTWTVPADWNNANNKIEVVGGGGNGGVAYGLGGGGGGGGAYSSISNLTLTPGATVSYNVGLGGSGGYGASGGNTWFNGTSLSAASVSAQGGSGGGNCPVDSSAVPAGGAGGQAANGIGTVKYSGGPGLNGEYGGGGGGGAAGPSGPGRGGGQSPGGNSTGGNGGGGSNGGSSTTGGNAVVGSTQFGAGGAGSSGSGGGATSGASGLNGGGGAGATGNTNTPGGNGSYDNWVGNGNGSGSGGGGGSGNLMQGAISGAAPGGVGAYYGGGGGGGGRVNSLGGIGGGGVIKILNCVPANPPVNVSSTISPNPVSPNGTNRYTITSVTTDAQGGSTIADQFALINYQGVNAPQYRGYVGWTTNNWGNQWGTTAALKSGSLKTCTGGGQAAIYNGYGQSYINLVSCTTAVSGTQRTSTFVVTFDPTFTTPVNTNTISAYSEDTGALSDGWDMFDTFNLVTCPVGQAWSGTACVSPPAAVTNFTASCPSPGTSAILNWTAVSQAAHYRVSVNNVNNGWGPVLCDGSINDGYTNDLCFARPTATTYTFAYGIPGADYTATINTVNAAGISATSSVAFGCSCPVGQTWNGYSCISMCTGGQTWNGTSCVCPSGVSCTCPSGQSWNGTSCVSFCTGGQIWNGASCTCPAGQTLVSGTCTGSCTDSYFCVGKDLYHQTTSCTNSLYRNCNFGCSAGACLFAPPATINFSVTPLLVRRGETVQVTWSTVNATACTVTSTNGASWTGLAGVQTSPGIQGQTIFNIRCTAASGVVASQSATANIIPVFCEPGTTNC